MIIFVKKNVFPWIRINRIIRDIPNLNIIGGNKNVNLHQKIIDREDVDSMCIRSREVKTNTSNIDEAELFIRMYNGVNSTEYFISYESPDQKILYGFLRLRINYTNIDLVYPILEDSAFIRELHVYGSVAKHNHKCGENVQHMGFGKKLLQKAEEIVHQHGLSKVAIISGVGVREYYQNQGYELINNYMVKHINYHLNNKLFEISIIFTILFICLSIIYDGLYL